MNQKEIISKQNEIKNVLKNSLQIYIGTRFECGKVTNGYSISNKLDFAIDTTEIIFETAIPRPLHLPTQILDGTANTTLLLHSCDVFDRVTVQEGIQYDQQRVQHFLLKLMVKVLSIGHLLDIRIFYCLKRFSLILLLLLW
ncbi:hypothetical protein RFI_38917 [Reticulomyxa filosa]|uniref:Uncharacterized protein n=1 Tax=Reticulomyxa filosa TaxID=46433 RepID=X6LB27_RETFI|nr:hypothetical protein RFI_38917 [Reticulomyxa filosa]|eukprot:ETN98575.1 hypothetical protein RFI_38917 [Reticulomyxa filosa]